MSDIEIEQSFSPTDLCANCPLRRGIDDESIVSVENSVGQDITYGNTMLVNVAFNNGRKASELFVIGGIPGNTITGEQVRERYENAKKLADDCTGPSLVGKALGKFGVGKCGAEFVKIRF